MTQTQGAIFTSLRIRALQTRRSTGSDDRPGCYLQGQPVQSLNTSHASVDHAKVIRCQEMVCSSSAKPHVHVGSDWYNNLNEIFNTGLFAFDTLSVRRFFYNLHLLLPWRWFWPKFSAPGIARFKILLLFLQFLISKIDLLLFIQLQWSRCYRHYHGFRSFCLLLYLLSHSLYHFRS